jgi:hypothetical protein
LLWDGYRISLKVLSKVIKMLTLGDNSSSSFAASLTAAGLAALSVAAGAAAVYTRSRVSMVHEICWNRLKQHLLSLLGFLFTLLLSSLELAAWFDDLSQPS